MSDSPSRLMVSSRADVNAGLSAPKLVKTPAPPATACTAVMERANIPGAAAPRRDPSRRAPA
eukprot:scaffold4145_cov115-Isochrysis_galbana.AAC.19